MRRPLLLGLWLASDLLLFACAYVFAYFARVGFIFSSQFPIGAYLTVVAVVAPLWLLVFISTGTFGLTRSQSTLRGAASVVYANIAGTALFALAYYFLYTTFFSRLLLVQAFLFSTIILWAWHLVFERFKRAMLRRDPPCFPTLIVGVTRESRYLIDLLESRRSPLRPVAVLDGAGVKDEHIGGVPVLGKLNRLEHVLKEKKITHLIQCSDLEQSLNLLSACRANGITYMLLPSVLGIVERDERIESVEGKALTVVGPSLSFWGRFFR